MSKTCPKNITQIPLSDCVGNSRALINSNFTSLKDAICTLTAGVSSITERLSHLPPVGTIIRFWGDISLGGTNFDLTGQGKIMAANSQNLSPWALCNGNNGTPNLEDRFIVGAGNLYSQMYPTGNRGPQINSSFSLAYKEVQLVIPEMAKHDHNIIDGIGNAGHNHPITILDHEHDYDDMHISTVASVVHSDLWVLNFTLIFPIPFWAGVLTDGRKPHCTIAVPALPGSGSSPNTLRRLTEPSISNMAPNTSNDASGITSQFTGNDVPHENRPPFRALGFIMRVV